jgi:hypothetical protein
MFLPRESHDLTLTLYFPWDIPSVDRMECFPSVDLYNVETYLSGLSSKVDGQCEGWVEWYFPVWVIFGVLLCSSQAF